MTMASREQNECLNQVNEIYNRGKIKEKRFSTFQYRVATENVFLLQSGLWDWITGYNTYLTPLGR